MQLLFSHTTNWIYLVKSDVDLMHINCVSVKYLLIQVINSNHLSQQELKTTIELTYLVVYTYWKHLFYL